MRLSLKRREPASAATEVVHARCAHAPLTVCRSVDARAACPPGAFVEHLLCARPCSGSHEHEPTGPGRPRHEPPSPGRPPLTSQRGFSCPPASGGPSILLALPPGVPAGWHSGLGDSSCWSGGVWVRGSLLGKAGPRLSPQVPDCQLAQDHQPGRLCCVHLGEPHPLSGPPLPLLPKGKGASRGAPCLSGCPCVRRPPPTPRARRPQKADAYPSPVRPLASAWSRHLPR